MEQPYIDMKKVPQEWNSQALTNTYIQNTHERYSVTRFFAPGLYHELVSPQAPEYTIWAVSNFFKNLRRYSQLNVDHRYQRHRQQILPPVSLVLLIPVTNLPPATTIPAANLLPVSTTPVANCHWCQRHRWQTMVLISGCRYLKVNLNAKMYTCVNSTIQRCPNKIIKNFLIEDFSQLPPVSTLSCEYLREFSKNFETVLMGYSGAGGKLIHEKNQKQKISWHCPFKLPWKMFDSTCFWRKEQSFLYWDQN